MNTMPWDYWLDAKHPKPATQEVIDTLENIMARQPTHPLALHLYIHAVEASTNPSRTEIAADTLANLVPASGHLVHMPAHIYWRVGRYNDAVQANIQAASVDEECNAQGFYPALYYPHNIHFLWTASSMMENSKLAIESARKVAMNVRLKMIEQFPTVEFFKTIPILALTQFGHWDEILAEPMPPAKYQYSNAIQHYARGIALLRRNDVKAAHTELNALQPLMDMDMDMDMIHTLDGSDYPASVLLSIAEHLLKGEIALFEGKSAEAISHFTQAVTEQDTLAYTEPPFWYYPTRQSLGQALIQAKKFAAAEQVYRKALQAYPKNGWSMFGLVQSLQAQNKQQEADKVQEMFNIVWNMADIKLEASRL